MEFRPTVVLTRVPRRMRRAITALIVLIAAALFIPIAAWAAPGDPPAPTVASVTAKLDALGRQTERLAEQYNKSRIDIAAAERAATAAQRQSASAAAKFHAARDQLRGLIAAQYEGGSFSSTGALLGSKDGQGYLDQLNTLNIRARQQTAVVAELTSVQAAADAAGSKASAAVRDAEAKRSAVTEQRLKVAGETQKYQALLSTLTAAQQAAYTTRQSATATQTASVTSVHAGNAAAQRAVDFALAQVGKPYVFAAAGPDAYDCSGLTMAAWAAGGVSLPHLASAQYDYGTHVSASQLQPGDLVFLYQPIDHVEIYIGNGMMVSAPQTGENVQIVSFANFAADFAGATRLA
ncbi:MAG: family secreted protein [Pseudonocardiales bacterium]|nr:family secreted protein [Pseudonocardiales bacterium]